MTLCKRTERIFTSNTCNDFVGSLVKKMDVLLFMNAASDLHLKTDRKEMISYCKV